MLHMLLSSGEVDGVIHVASTLDAPPAALSRYGVSRTMEAVAAGANRATTSRRSLKCSIRCGKNLAATRSSASRASSRRCDCCPRSTWSFVTGSCSRRHWCVAITSRRCTPEYLAWSSGLLPKDVVDIDYRHKEPGRPPNRYSVRVSSRDGRSVVSGVEKIPMADWGMGIFKLGACDYCDDIVGETADVSFGDAWLPPFMSDWQGANLAIARSPLAERILEDGEAKGSLEVIPWSAEDVADAQAGAVRHRRAGLAVRLANRIEHGRWAPPKRVEPVAPDDLSSAFAQRMLNREAIATASPAAFLEARRRGDLQEFRRIMQPLIWRYDGGRGTTIWRRTAARTLRRLPPKGEALVRRLLGGRRFS